MASWLVRFHLAGLVIWLVLGVPTMMTWKDSVPFVSFMSWYAIVVSHWSGWDAARAERKVEEITKED